MHGTRTRIERIILLPIRFISVLSVRMLVLCRCLLGSTRMEQIKKKRICWIRALVLCTRGVGERSVCSEVLPQGEMERTEVRMPV